MNNILKLTLYVLMLVCVAFFGGKTMAHYRGLGAEPPVEVEPGEGQTERPSDVRRGSDGLGRMMTYGFLAFGALVVLALLLSRDVSRFMAHRTERFLFSDDGEGMRDPEYEEAEQVWANGQFLESIQLMRDYLKKHPRELHAALRIAEIYEKDLGNHLAAALEYEEVIKHNLPPERWGWAAIHLANLYSGKLNRAEEALKLLRRIVNEYGQTSAAKKARERLARDTSAGAETPPDASDSNLPPGFTLKK